MRVVLLSNPFLLSEIKIQNTMTRMEFHAGTMVKVPRKENQSLKEQLVELLLTESWEDKPDGIDEVALHVLIEEQYCSSLEEMVCWNFEHRYHVFQGHFYKLDNIELEDEIFVRKIDDKLFYSIQYYNGGAGFSEMIDKVLKNAINE